MANNNSKACDFGVNASVLQRFSREVLGLTELSRCPSSKSWLHKAVQGLGNVVSFDTAWWGQVYIPSDTSSPKNLMHGSLGLSASFAEEWNSISGIDRFAKASISSLGKAVRGSHGDFPSGMNAEVESFCRRHDLFHGMAVTLELPSSGMLFFVSIYRGRSSFGFDDVDSILLEEFIKHLARCWQVYLMELRSDGLPGVWDGYALSSMKGELLYIGREIGVALEGKYVGWQGSSLPVNISDMLNSAPCTVYPDGKNGITVQHCGDLVSLMLCSRQHTASLSPRELSAARLYSQGSSYKEVARILGITPATARTYLRSAYIRLGVSNKVELISALRQPGGE